MILDAGEGAGGVVSNTTGSNEALGKKQTLPNRPPLQQRRGQGRCKASKSTSYGNVNKVRLTLGARSRVLPLGPGPSRFEPGFVVRRVQSGMVS